MQSNDQAKANSNQASANNSARQQPDENQNRATARDEQANIERDQDKV